ncbi:MAG TPA: IPT/TIG domain-containing protein [Verrucomicrobiae bacterium]|nr:IPT/TIG domain-containing protein [Verrucomicrobiae bacterium]
MTTVKLLCLLTLGAALAHGQNQCVLELASQSDEVHSGFILFLSAAADSSGNCQLGSVTLGLSVGNGKSLHTVQAPFSWQTGVVYTATAVITGAGPQQLSINGQSAGSVAGAFVPAQGTLYASNVNDSGTATEAYIVTQISLQVSNGSNTVSVAPNGNAPIPLPLVLLGGGPVPWETALTVDPTKTTTITATFQCNATVANPHQFDPYIDTYGQAIAASWPSKITSDSDLQTVAAQEQAWLASDPPVAALDPYGGSTIAGWTGQATGYYYAALHNGHWYMISPLGNPLFYLGLTSIGDGPTAITGRESMFQLPPQSGAFAAAYTTVQGVTRVSFSVANQIIKYGSSWKATGNTLLHQRFPSWGFMGGGKFGTFPADLPSTPVLTHSDVPNAVPGGHPDAFDPNIVSELKTSLAAQMESSVSSPDVVGWSVGNEIDEIIQSSEVTAILALGSSSTAKMAFVNQALNVLYGGSVSKLATAWKISATTVAGVYAATNAQPPASDVESLRQFYAGAYYSILYKTVKSIDPNHVYFGIWILPSNDQDWALVAANCDVVGFDDFNPSGLTSDLLALFTSTNKPVMIGAWVAAADYGGTRGFGWLPARVMALSDSASGDAYTQLLASFAANPYMVGSMIFQYGDGPLTGTGAVSGSALVIGGNNIAWGMVDVTDTPKYDLVNKVRAANIAALQSLQLLGTAPALTSSPQNGATYLTGGLVPGSWAQVKGTNLSDVSRTWRTADFANLGDGLPTVLSGVQVLVNGTAAAVYYISPTQISFQVPAGISGTANVEVIRDGVASNTLSGAAVSSAPGIFPVIVNGTNYPAAVFPDGMFVGDPSVSSSFRNARPGDTISLFATGLAASPAGTTVGVTPLTGVTITIGGITINADFAGLVAVGEFQINFTVPQQFAIMPAGNYPITISVNGVSSPTMINSNPPAPIVLSIQQ